MSPFDLLIAEHPVQTAQTPLEFYKQLDFPELPKFNNPVPNPTSTPTVGFVGNTPKSSEPPAINLSEIMKGAKQEKGFFTEETNIARYHDKDYTYSPYADMEEVYASKQSNAEAWAGQWKRTADNFKSFYINGYVGIGRTAKELLGGSFDTYASFNKTEQYLDALQRDYREYTDPIYRSKDASWFAGNGDLGDLVPSVVGFGGAAIAGALQDFVMGRAITTGVAGAAGALAAGGPVAALAGAGVAAAGAGIASLFSKTVEDAIGEQTSNFLLGSIVSGAGTSLIQKFTSAKNLSAASLRATQASNAAIKATPKFKQLLDVSLSANVAKAAEAFKKEMTAANIIGSRLPQLSITAVKSYLSAGAEAGMESMDAQLEYVANFYEEKERKGEEITLADKLMLQTDMVEMGKEVYNANKIINAVSNFVMFGDIMSGAAYKAGVKNMGLRYAEGKILDKSMIAKLSPIKLVGESLSEGVEEFSQLVVSTGAQERMKHKYTQSYSGAYLDAAAKLIQSKEGWKEFMAGALGGLGMMSAKKVYQGVLEKVVHKGSFLDGVTGINQEYKKSIIEVFKKNTDKIDRIAKSGKGVPQQEDFDDAIWDMFSLASKTGQVHLFNEYIEDTFTNNKDIDSMFRGATPDDIKEMKNTYKNEILKKAKRVQESYDIMHEYFKNPFMTNSMFKNVPDKKLRAQIYDDLVGESARLLFLKQNNIEDALNTRKQLDKVLGNSPIYEFFKDDSILDYDSDGVAAFKKAVADERLIINSLGDSNPVRAKRLDMLEKLLNDFTATPQADVIPGMEKFHNPMLGYLTQLFNISDNNITAHAYFEKFGVKRRGNPALTAKKLGISVAELKEMKEMFKNGTSLPETQSAQDIFEALHNMKKVNKNLTFITNDLSNMMDVNKQVAYVDYLMSLRESVKKGIDEDIKSITMSRSAEVKSNLDSLAIDSASKKLYKALDSLGLIDATTITCI